MIESNSIRWGVTLLTFSQAVISALSLTVQQRSIRWLGLHTLWAHLVGE